MVNLSTVLLIANRSNRSHQQWVESLRVYCKGGRGGNGLPTVGGIGGRGGDVTFECHEKKSTQDPFASLHQVFMKVFKGDSAKQKLLGGIGANARVQRVIGEAGSHAILKVFTIYIQQFNEMAVQVRFTQGRGRG